MTSSLRIASSAPGGSSMQRRHITLGQESHMKSVFSSNDAEPSLQRIQNCWREGGTLARTEKERGTYTIVMNFAYLHALLYISRTAFGVGAGEVKLDAWRRAAVRLLCRLFCASHGGRKQREAQTL